MKGRIFDFNQPQGGPPRISIPEAGRFSVGEWVEGQGNRRGHPKSLDYFRIYRGDASVSHLFRETYGEKPTEIKVSFLSSDPARVCRQELELRPGKKYAWGDGETFVHYDAKLKTNVQTIVSSQQEQIELMARLEAEATDYVRSRRAAQNKPFTTEDEVRWDQSLTLRLWLYELPVAGEFIFRTKGEATSIPSIVGTFDTVLYAAKTVQFLPFSLRVRQHSADNMTGSKYPIVELVPPSAQAIAAVGDLGSELYATIFGDGNRMTVLSEENILEAATGLRQLQAGTGINKIEVRSDPEIAEVDPDLEAAADEFFETILETPRAIVEAGGLEALPSGAKIPTANPGSLAFAIQAMTLAGSWELAKKSWNENQEDHGGSKVYRKTALLRFVSLTRTKSELDALVRDWSEFHPDEDFRAAVKARRDKNGWLRD